jgi:sugar (pentulose or hexulose) kinase
VDAVRAGVGATTEVRLAGGWVRSPGWVEIKSAVNGYRTVAILEPEVTAVGAALLAARARGWTVDPVIALGAPGMTALS